MIKVKKKEEYSIKGYTILEMLGQGGMGVVFKATKNDRIVALKVMSSALLKDAMCVERFVREAEISIMLDHPNIVKGLDYQASDVVYFAMEFVEGISLDKILEKEGKLPEKQACQIVLQMAKALEYADQFKIVHRDIKPGNIMMTRDGIPKLCDLGLAKRESAGEHQLTQPGSILGTPFYMSPEQVRSQSVEIKTDIYALGITFYNLVTGDLPFKGNSLDTILKGHLYDPLPDPREIVPALSGKLYEIISRMVEKELPKRCSPGEVVSLLNDFLEPKQESAKPLHQAPFWLRQASQVVSTIDLPVLEYMECQKTEETAELGKKEEQNLVNYVPEWLKQHIEVRPAAKEAPNAFFTISD